VRWPVGYDARSVRLRSGLAACGVLLPVALLVLLDGEAVGQVRGAPAGTMDVSEIRPGMRGYGLSVFSGVVPERFEVEVIEVLHQFRPDQDLILVRTAHPILTEAPTVGGMSGSPIYLEDRLVGAYAYGWPFGRHPVAGVTPIANMMREIDRPVRPDSFPGAIPLGSVRSSERPRAASRRRSELAGLDPYAGTAPRGALGSIGDAARRVSVPDVVRDGARIAPASTPMLVGGLEPGAVQILSDALAPFGIDVLQAGGAGTTAAAGPPPRFVDGGGIAVTVARGDIASNVVGTVTHVRGDRLVAFGHPMLEIGETGLPTAVARVLHILASVQRSFKIAEPAGAVGALIHDRQATIVVDQSLEPAMIPVRLRISGIPESERTEWNFEVASHRAITPLLVFTAIASAVKSVAADNAHVMFEGTSRVWIDGRPSPVELVDRGYSSSGPSAQSALQQLRGFDVVELAFANPFVDTRPTRIEVDLALRFAQDTAEIVDASVASTEVDPGEPVHVRVVVRPHARPEEVRIVEVQIPDGAAGQTIAILIQPGGEVEIERPDPRSLDDSIAAIRERYGPTSMVVSTRLPSRGLRMAGHVVRSLPGSALDALQRTGDSDRARPFTTHLRQEIRTDTVLTGGARVDLTVRRVPRPE
jgi:hypothetical protein